jgi:pilus assembly protein TadC
LAPSQNTKTSPSSTQNKIRQKSLEVAEENRIGNQKYNCCTVIIIKIINIKLVLTVLAVLVPMRVPNYSLESGWVAAVHRT